jgi:glycosidase
VTAVWLMPFQPSPGRDDGYDITDYYGVNPAYGTLGDFVEFTHAAKQRGIRVLIDLVVNHTSDQHPWFRAARSDPNSPFRDWYVWSERKPPDAAKGMVFPGVQKSTWSYDREAKAWYFHRFYDFQPDLNTPHPKVQAEILKIMGFWLQLGVSGFRMDAVPFVISKKGANVRRPVEQYDILRLFREFLQWREGDAIILAEANVLPKTDMEYFGDAGDRMHMMFNFQVNQALFYALASADCRLLIKALYATRPRPATAQWGMFLRNHDELDLGRLTQQQRQKVFDAFGPSKEMQLYDRGIRRRLNAAAQRRDPNSMLNWTERIIRMRKEVPEVGWGDFEAIDIADRAVLVLRYDWRNNSVLFVHNLDDKPHEVSVSLGRDEGGSQLLVNLLSDAHSRAGEDGKHHLLIEAYGYRWFRVGGLDYLLKRSDIDVDSRQKLR